MATIKDVANHAGVAYSTASLALRGIGKVAPATRQRVLQAAQALQYQRNAAATVLAGGRTYQRTAPRALQVAFVQPSSNSASASRGELQKGVQEARDKFGYGLEQLTFDELRQTGTARMLWQRGVEGLILTDSQQRPTPRFDFPWERFAVVKVRRVLPWLSVDMVRVSAPEMVMLALNAIYERAYRSVLCLLQSSPSEMDDDLRVGALHVYRERHLKPGSKLAWHQLEPSMDHATDDSIWA